MMPSGKTSLNKIKWKVFIDEKELNFQWIERKDLFRNDEIHFFLDLHV